MRLKHFSKIISKSKWGNIEAREKGDSIIIEGRTDSWIKKIQAGYIAAKFGWNNIVNDIETGDAEPESFHIPINEDQTLEAHNFDVAIIGGGIIGTSIARELSRYNLSIILLEKEYDLGVHASSRNNGMIHDGFAPKTNTKKAVYNVTGNRLWEPLCKELDLEFIRPGSLVLFRSTVSTASFPIMAARAHKNDVDGFEFWAREKVFKEEPNVTTMQHGGLFLPSAGIISPHKAVVALAENAIANGVRLELNSCVSGFNTSASENSLTPRRIDSIITNKGTFKASIIINAAGVWADILAGLAGDRFFSLHGRRGVIVILDLKTGSFQNHILSMPSILHQAREHTKGGGLIKTIEGNILVGPTATEIPGREDYSTHFGQIQELEKHFRLNNKLSRNQVITYFAGIRSCTYNEDFLIERGKNIENLIHVAGIQSPGLASAPAIAKDVSLIALDILSRKKTITPNQFFDPVRKKIPELARLSFEKRAEIIAKNRLFGHVICRCESVSEGEIKENLKTNAAVFSVDSIKRRTRAGMGRCHGSFCLPRVMEIIASEKNIPLSEVEKKGPGTRIVIGVTKEETNTSINPSAGLKE